MGQATLRLEPGIGHTSVQSSAVYSPDQEYILTGGWDQTARLWDVATGRQIRTFSGHEGWVVKANFSPDGKLAVTASMDNTARIWEVATGRLLHTLKGHTIYLSDACFSPDGQFVATSGWDRTARLWSVQTGQEVRSFLGHSAYVTSLEFSRDGKLLLTSGGDKLCRLWNVADGTEIRQFAGHTDDVLCARFAPDAKTMVSCSRDKTVRIWDVQTGAEKRKITLPKLVAWLSFAPNGKTFAGEFTTYDAAIWDAATGAQVDSTSLQCDAASIEYSPDGKRILMGGNDCATHVWTPGSKNAPTILSGHGGWVYDASFLKDSRSIATTGFALPVTLWNFEAAKHISPSRFVERFALSPDGATLIGAKGDAVARQWDLKSGREIRVFKGHLENVTCAAFSPDGKLLVTGSNDHTARTWDVATSQELKVLKGHADKLETVVFSPNGDQVVTTADDKTIRFWSTASGEELHRIETASSLYDAQFSPDGSLVAAGDTTGISVYDAKSYKIEHRLVRRQAGEATKVGQIELWLNGFSNGAATTLCWSKDGKILLAGYSDGKATVWQVDSDREQTQLIGHTGSITSARYSPDNRWIVTASWDGTTRLWDATTGKEQCALVVYDNNSWSVIDPEGRYDSSDGGRNPNLYWIYENPERAITETVDLEQFASAYYTPGLLEKKLNREELPKVPELTHAPLFPQVDNISVKGQILSFTLTPRDGGIGNVRVFVQGQEVAQTSGKAGVNQIQLPAGLKNPTCDVVAFNRDNSLSSPLARSGRSNSETSIDQSTPTRYVAVLAGINSYRGSLSSLNFAVADAMAMGKAIKACAAGLGLTPEIYLLTNDPAAKPLAAEGFTLLPATVDSFRRLFETQIPGKGVWRKSDELFVFLAGHGTSYQQDGAQHYAYLTQDATSADMSLPEVRALQALTDDDLVRYLAKFIDGKKAMVLDTCAAGAAAGVIQANARSDDPELARTQAVYETQRRTGIRVLFGCPGDLVSYESPEYGHGLLTWSLLNSLANDSLGTEQMKNAVLVDTLFGRAAETTQRESGAKSTQRALMFGRGENFPLGYLDDKGKRAIPFSSRLPLVGLVSVNNRDKDLDDLDLSTKLTDALRIVTFLRYSPDSPRAYRVQGGYSVTGDTVTLRLNLVQKDKAPLTLEVAGLRSGIISAAVAAIEKALARPSGS